MPSQDGARIGSPHLVLAMPYSQGEEMVRFIEPTLRRKRAVSIQEATFNLEGYHGLRKRLHTVIDCETLPVCPRESVTARGPDPISLFSAPLFECATLGIKFAGSTS